VLGVVDLRRRHSSVEELDRILIHSRQNIFHRDAVVALATVDGLFRGIQGRSGRVRCLAESVCRRIRKAR
jgi:hypothetical protein